MKTQIILQAILTKVIPATNTKPTRIKASSASGFSVVKTYHNCDGNEAQKHREAAQALADKLQWKNEMAQGGTKDGYAFVLLA